VCARVCVRDKKEDKKAIRASVAQLASKSARA